MNIPENTPDMPHEDDQPPLLPYSDSDNNGAPEPTFDPVPEMVLEGESSAAMGETANNAAVQSEHPGISRERDIDDLTLGQFFGRLVRAPIDTFAQFREAINELPEDRAARSDRQPRPARVPSARPKPIPTAPVTPESQLGDTQALPHYFTLPVEAPSRGSFTLAVSLFVILSLAVFASLALQASENRGIVGVPSGAVPLAAAWVVTFALVLGNGLGFVTHPLPRLALPRLKLTLNGFIAKYSIKFAVMGIAALGSAAAWIFTEKNAFTTEGFVGWVVSILAWLFVFNDGTFRPLAPIGRFIQQSWAWLKRPRVSWTAVLLLVILLVGVQFRLSNLSLYPPDMTSDHVEKALDAQKILDGLRPVFLPNNGGREAFQMYLLAAMHQITGIPIGHDLLKLASGIEGLLVIALAFFVGRSIFGTREMPLPSKDDLAALRSYEQRRILGNLTGLFTAAMIATSYWHTMLSRLGLRIVLTTLIVFVIVYFLSQAMRFNRRGDWLLVGLSLGIGLYFYQAVRMVPLLVAAGTILAVVLRVRSWRVLWSYAINAFCAVVIAAAVFVPLGRYWADYPTSFWERTGGRFFGEDTIVERDDQGNVIRERAVTEEERQAAFRQNLAVFGDNLVKSLAMFTYQGDTAWITGSPDGFPQLDPYAGTFFILGLGVVIGRALRRGDPTEYLLPLGILLLVLPSALSIAFTIEVPSATRASGALPFVYLVAGAGMAFVVYAIARGFPAGIARRVVYIGAIVPLLLGAFVSNERYFVEVQKDYRVSTYPYRQVGGILRAFIDSTGAPGNAFMIAFPYWWDHRAIAIEANEIDWNNGILRETMIPNILNFMRANYGTPYEFRPDRQVMFFINPNDLTVVEELEEVFPNGSVIPVTAFNADRSFNLYVVQPLGCDWLREYLDYESRYCAQGVEISPGG